MSIFSNIAQSLLVFLEIRSFCLSVCLLALKFNYWYLAVCFVYLFFNVGFVDTRDLLSYGMSFTEFEVSVFICFNLSVRWQKWAHDIGWYFIKIFDISAFFVFYCRSLIKQLCRSHRSGELGLLSFTFLNFLV